MWAMTVKRPRLQAPRPVDGAPVTTLELFFDLVFVFSVTQLTGLVLHSHGASGYLHAGAVLVVIFWMYDGYAWLSNNVGPNSASTRIPMLLAMTGFLVMAIAIPNVFGHTAWQFAVAYLLVVALHAWSFTRSSLGSSAVAIRGILPYNLAIGLGLVLAATLGPGHAWVGWTLSVLVIVVTVLRNNESGFSLRAEHFAERHQLIIIIALGETVIATGLGAGGHIDKAQILAAVLISMALIAGLWWLYFGADDARASHAFASIAPERMAHEAIQAYFIAHLLHIAGLVLLAAGLHLVVHAPGHQLGARMALTMAAGCSTYLAGEVLFRARLGLGAVLPLAVGSVALLATTTAGIWATGLVQLGAMTVVVAAVVGASALAERQPTSASEGELDIGNA